MKKERAGLINKNNRIYVLMTLVAIVCGLVWCVTNVSLDVTYQFAMSYRLVNGDVMFREMWEPHQTSAFLNAVFMYPFLKLNGSAEGIVVYLQVIGILFRALVAYFVYRVFSKTLKKPVSYATALVIFLVSPKDLAPADFSNMQLWFSTLMLCFLILYFRNGSKRYVVGAALSLCLLVLSYPSCLIMYFTAVALMAAFGGKKKTSHIILFTCICMLAGGLAVVFWLVNFDEASIKECIVGMFSLEPSHTAGISEKMVRYGKNIAELALCFAVIIGASAIIERVGCFWGASKGSRKFNFDLFVFASLAILAVGFFINILSALNRCAFGVILIYVIILGFVLKKNLSREEKVIYYSGSFIGITAFLATIALSDLPMIVSVPYLVLAAAVALIPVFKYAEITNNVKFLKTLRIFAFVFVLLWAFRAAYIRTPILGRAQIMSSFDGISLIRVGPAKGIITGDESCVKEREGYYDFTENVPRGSKVMIVGSLVDSLAYMYGNYEVAAPSVMSDPKYSDGVSEYFRINPDKFPDIVAVPSYQGELDYDVRANEWLYNWITKEYPAKETKEGTFWTFYFR